MIVLAAGLWLRSAGQAPRGARTAQLWGDAKIRDRLTDLPWPRHDGHGEESAAQRFRGASGETGPS